MERSAIVSWALVALVGCASDDGSERPGDAPTSPGVGQTGSPGGYECIASSECQAGAEERVARLRVPEASSRTFIAGSCVDLHVISDDGTASGPACACAVDATSAIHVGPKGAGCGTVGRAGECLFDNETFAGCTVGDDATCKSVCDDLSQRYAADAARTHDATVLSSACTEHACVSVAKIDGRCYVNGSWTLGRAYDCNLGVDGVIAAYRADQRSAMPSTPPAAAVPSAVSPYVKDTLGMVQIGVTRTSEDTGAPLFFFGAQFANVTADGDFRVGGDVLDPFTGLDDCGVLRATGFSGSNNPESFFHIDRGQLTHGTEQAAIVPTAANNATFSSYTANVDMLTPHFGERYEVDLQAVQFGGATTVPLTLPEDLQIRSLLGMNAISKRDLALRWTGTSDAPLRVRLQVSTNGNDALAFDAVRLDCALQDDGEYVIPSALLALLPDGMAELSFIREHRSVEGAPGKQLLALGTNNTTLHVKLAD